MLHLGLHPFRSDPNFEFKERKQKGNAVWPGLPPSIASRVQMKLSDVHLDVVCNPLSNSGHSHYIHYINVVELQKASKSFWSPTLWQYQLAFHDAEGDALINLLMPIALETKMRAMTKPINHPAAISDTLCLLLVNLVIPVAQVNVNCTWILILAKESWLNLKVLCMFYPSSQERIEDIRQLYELKRFVYKRPMIVTYFPLKESSMVSPRKLRTGNKPTSDGEDFDHSGAFDTQGGLPGECSKLGGLNVQTQSIGVSQVRLGSLSEYSSLQYLLLRPWSRLSRCNTQCCRIKRAAQRCCTESWWHSAAFTGKGL